MPNDSVFGISTSPASIPMNAKSTPNRTGAATPGTEEQRDFPKTAGLDYPIIKINGYVFGIEEINSLSIEIEDFLPHIILEVETATNSLTGVNMPKDGDLISLFMRSPNKDLVPLRMDFIIMKASSSQIDYTKKVTRRRTKYWLQGDLYVPKMTSEVDQFSFCGTSKEAVIDFCERYKLGFCYTDEDNTDDKQIWLCYSNTPEQYIKSVVSHAWKDKTSFFDCWVDQYYNLNFINVNDILGRELADDGTMDIGKYATSLSTFWEDGKNTKNKKEDQYPKLFTNAVWFENSVWYISSWKPINRSSQVTLNEGTSIEAEFFLANQYLFDNGLQQDTSVLCEPAYNPDKLANHLLLRGRTNFSMGFDKMSNNGDFVDIYRKTPWFGVQYVMSDSDKESTDQNNNSWSGNLHKNYYRAEAHNRINLKELDKLNIELTFEGLNLHILRGEKIPVIIYDQNGPLAEKNKDGTALQDSNYDMAIFWMYSGWFMIDSVRYEYEPNEDRAVSNFKTIVTVTRREWVCPEPVESIATTNNNKGTNALSESQVQDIIKNNEDQVMMDENLNDKSTARIKQLKSQGNLALANKLSNEWEKIEDVFKRAGLKVRVTSGYRGANNSIGKAGSKSNHTVQNFAVDIVPLDGDFKALKEQMLSSPVIQEYFKARQFGILDETTAEALAATGGTGAHWHIGPDTSAIKTWNSWNA